MKVQSAKPGGTRVTLQSAAARLPGILTIPEGASAIVLFAHGICRSDLSSRDQIVARELNEAGIATLLFDLLTPFEEARHSQSGPVRAEIDFLADRLVGAIDWIDGYESTQGMQIGLFGSSAGAAVAFRAAARRQAETRAVVSGGARLDFAGAALAEVRAPALLIVGGRDRAVIVLNDQARSRMRVKPKLEILPGASHLFEEPGAWQEVSQRACTWFREKLKQPGRIA